MAKLIKSPSLVKAAGNKPKIIEEYIGKVNSGENQVSIARMKSPQGWVEPGQKPDFDEYTLVLKGGLLVETKNETFYLTSGQAILLEKNEWVRYSSPKEEAEYISVCLPAFSPDAVHRDGDQ